MFLRTLPLRLKLIAAVLIPLAVVAGFLSVQVAGGLEDRTSAQNQLAEVQRFEAVTDYATALGTEATTVNDTTSTAADLESARAAADAAWAIVASPAVDVGGDRLAALEAIQLDVNDIRAIVGTDPAAYRATIVRGSSSSMSDNPVSRLSALRNNVLNGFGFDRSAITDPTIAQLVNDVQLLERIDGNLATEASLLVSARTTFGTDVMPALVELQNAISRTDEAIAVLNEVASLEATATFSELSATSEWAGLEAVRDSLRGTQLTGDAVTLSIPEIQNIFTAVDQSLTAAEVAQNDLLEVNALLALDDANGQLIRAGAIGGGLLLLVAIIVFVLYQAIRQPLRDLTDEARRVSEVELPEVVRAVRAGEPGAGENIEQIDAYTDDEVGELVAAFNGMHRTAVDLAAEQAGSRRVVADMFVNLGRRNQKLLNRMLKGLTVLEREEQDPDKLEALYKVDHLATRMRRNAESLLILAGASQARSWNKSVPVYDVVQAALAEVENFERVEIEVTDEDLVKGDYVADLAHILAELTENALAFSPPGSQVDVLARQTRKGYAIIITDAGIGMPADQLEQANARIIAAGSQDETPSEFLGHYVVGRLAARHGFTVDLLEGIAGLSVRVLLPDTVFDRVDDEPQSDLSGLSSLSQASAVEPAAAPAPAPAIDETFATMPDSLPIDSIPAAETAGDMEPFETDFASVPADSLDIEGMGDDSFATVPADSLDWDEVDETDATDEHARPDVSDVHDDVEEMPAEEPVTVVDEHAAVAEVVETAEAVETAEVVEEILLGDPAQPLVPPIDLPQRRPKREATAVAEAEVAATEAAEATDADAAPDLPQRRPQPISAVVPTTDSGLPQRRPGRAIAEAAEAAQAVPTASLTQPPSGAAASMPEPAPVATAPLEPASEPTPEPALAGAFGVRRRTPGANLPVTTITPKNVIETDLDNPDEVRSSLSGFQSGTARADKENN